MPTYSPKASEITRRWYVVDADGLVLGRMSTEVARILRGKHKPTFAPHLDTGDPQLCQALFELDIALLAKRLTLSGSGAVHYDEDLGGSGSITNVQYRVATENQLYR